MATLGELIVSIGANISGFSSAMKEVDDTLKDISHTATESLEHFDGIMEGLGEIAAAAGIATGAFEIAKEALESFSKAQDVTTSFELLTGSASAAENAFDGLKETALKLALPFESLVSVSQKLAPQFGVGTKQMNEALTAAADAAAATGRSFDTIAEGLDRIAITGQVSTRQMVQFGVSMSDIANAMGVSVTEAMDKLKKGGQSAQDDVNAVIGAIEAKFDGAAEKIGENLKGQFTKMKDELAFVSEDLGKALAPLAEDLIAGLKELEPTLKGIAEGAIPAVNAFIELGKSIADLIPDFVKVIASGPSMIALGTAIGFTAQAGKLLVDILHAVVLETTDFVESLNPFSDGLKHLRDDFNQAGIAIGKDISQFGEIAAKGDELQKTFDKIKTPNLELPDNVVPKWDGGKNAANALKDAVKDLALADKDHAEYLKTTYVSAITTVEDAESKLHDARLAYLTADQAEQTTRQDLLEAQKNKTSDIIAIEAKLKDQSQATKDAHLAYTEAIKDQNLAKTTLVTATKNILDAEADVSAALKANYIPALLDHKTALENIVIAEQNQKAAIEAVGAAEVNLQNAMPKPGSPGDPVTIKAAEDALATTRQNLKDAVVKLTQAHKDETSSLNLLQSVQKDIDATDKLLIANKRLLLPATRDLIGAVKDYDSALADARVADQNLRDAEQELINVRSNELASGRDLEDALNKEKDAKDAVSVANVRLSDATRTLTSDFRVNRDTLDLLTRHTNDWTQSQKDAEVAMSGLGNRSVAVLGEISKQTTAAYNVILNDPYASVKEKMEALLISENSQIALLQQQGVNTDNLQLKAIHLADALHTMNVGFTDTVIAMHNIITSGFDTALNDLITQSGNVGDAFKKMGESLATTFADRIVNDALKPVEKELDFLMDKALTAAEKLLHIPVPGSSNTDDLSAVSGIPKIPIPSSGIPGLPTGGPGGIPGMPQQTIGDIPTLPPPDIGTPVGDVGGGITSAASSTVSSSLSGVLTNFVAPISAAVSAISGVVSIFQNMHQETSLNAIELNTRITSILLGSIDATGKQYQDADSIKGWTKFTGMTVGEIKTALYDVIHNDLVGISGAMSNIGAAAAPDLSRIFDPATVVLQNIQDFDWSALHPDLVGIWTGIGDIKNSVVALPSQFSAALTAIPAPQFKFAVLLDGRELTQSFVTNLSQSGTVAPQV